MPAEAPVTMASGRAERLSSLRDGADLGFVENPYGYIAEAQGLIAPLFHGAGIKVKVVEALALGGEDLCADLGCPRTKEGTEIFYSRSRLLLAARAAGVDAVDTPFTDARDEEGCYADTVYARGLGFDGKLSISPHHLRPIHRAFTPTEEAVAFALEVVDAMERAKREGRGAVSLRGKMIDLPVLRQAERTLELARASGMLTAETEGAPQ